MLVAECIGGSRRPLLGAMFPALFAVGKNYHLRFGHTMRLSHGPHQFFFVGPLIPLFWTSGDVSGFQPVYL